MSAAALPMITQGISTAGNAYQQSQSIKAQGAYSKAIAETNKSFAELQADDAVKRGNLASLQQQGKTAEFVSSQKAALAAQGIELDSGTAESLLRNTESLGELDAVNIKSNAWKEAWGFKSQANQYSAEGKAAELTSKNLAKSTLLTGGIQALGAGTSAYAAYKKGS